jgi:hypothetical protein
MINRHPQHDGQTCLPDGVQTLRSSCLPTHLLCCLLLHLLLQDLQQAAVQHLQAIFNMPAADSNTDAPDGPPSNSSSSSSSRQFLTPMWMSNRDMQQLVADQPRSSAAYGSTQLRSGAGAATWHPQLTLPYNWTAQPVTAMHTVDIGSISQRTAATPVNSSSSSSSSVAEVDLVDYSGSTQMYLQLDPLCSQGVLFEDSQDFSGPGAAAAVAAERDEAFATMRSAVLRSAQLGAL